MNGTVIDSMTRRPVLAATVGVAGHSTKTDSRGAFKLPGVAANATLTISCRNYNSTTIRAAPRPASIRLTPIPVRVKVASALTGAPLGAAIQTPDRVRVVASAAGVATVYRVVPGDRVTVSAAGYRPASVRVGADRTVRAGLQPLAWKTAAVQLVRWYKAKEYAAIANWMLSPTTGYEYDQHSPETSATSPWRPRSAGKAPPCL